MLAEPFNRQIAVIMLFSRKVAPCAASISLIELALDQGLAQSPRKVVGFCRSAEKETDRTTAGGESWTKKRKPGNVTPRIETPPSVFVHIQPSAAKQPLADGGNDRAKWRRP
jgi:hypothetical protein